MAITNRERVGKALDLLNEGLRPFVERELKGVHGNKWEDVAREGQPPERGKETQGRDQKFHFDTQGLLAVLWNQWNVVFAKTLGPAERSLVSELRDIRNKWAHQEAFASSDAYRALGQHGTAARRSLGIRSGAPGTLLGHRYAMPQPPVTRRDALQRITTELESKQTFPNLTALWAAVENTEWAKAHRPRPVGSAVASPAPRNWASSTRRNPVRSAWVR